MSSELLESGLVGTLALTTLVSLLTLAGTGVPFYRGLRIFFEAYAATRLVQKSELRQDTRDAGPGGVEPLGKLLVRIIQKSVRESGDGQPRDFIVDASRQYVMNEYDAHYSQRISMYANILPPIGFIGTTTGLFILFLSMRVSSESLELSALALALTSSIFALIGFAVLEGLKIFLYGRMLASLSHVLAMRGASPRASQPTDSAAAKSAAVGV
jgi:hypothetical protein